MRYECGCAVAKSRLWACLFANVLAAFLYMAIVFTPYLSRHFLFTLGIPLVLSWIVFAFLFSPKSLGFNPVLLVMFAFLAWVTTTRLLGHGSASWGNVGALMLYFFPLYMYFYYKRLRNDRVSKWIVLVAIGLLTGNVIDNIRLLAIHPYAAKFLTGSLFVDGLQHLNVGTVPFTSAVAVLLPTLLALAGHGKLRLCLYALTAIILSYIYMALSVTTLLIAVWSVILLSLMSIRNVAVRFVLYCVCAIVLVVGMFYLPSLLSSLASSLDTQAIAERIYSISLVLRGTDVAESSFMARMRNLHLSLSTFLSYPFFGVGFQTSVDRYATGVGMHSQVFDDLARFGLVGIVLNGFMYLSFVKPLLRTQMRVTKGLAVSYIAFIIMSIFNTSIFPETGLVIFLLLPLIADLSYKYFYGNRSSCVISGSPKQSNAF